jgi:hypothetical protein
MRTGQVSINQEGEEVEKRGHLLDRARASPLSKTGGFNLGSVSGA